MRIATNVQSMVAQRALGNANSKESSANTQLASGDAIFQSSLNPSGLAISTKMMAQMRGNAQAIRNANDGMSLLQVAEGSLAIIHDLGGRLKELVLQTATDTITDSERYMADKEYQELKTEISRLAQSTKFNGHNILRSDGQAYDFQIGINNSDYDKIVYDMSKALERANQMRHDGTSITTKIGSQNAIGEINKMMEYVSVSRASLGSTSNRMQSVMNNLEFSSEKLAGANSKIRDTEIAATASQRASQGLIKAASASVLTQANSQPSYVLKLLS